MNNQSKPRGTPVWVWLLAGCGGLVVLFVAVISLVGYLGFRKVKEIGEQMEDPEARRGKVLEVLGAQSLPEGYEAVFAVEIPFLMEVAILSDQVPESLENVDHTPLGDRSLLYFRMRNFDDPRRDIDRFFDGESRSLNFGHSSSSDIDLGDRIAAGELVLDEGDLRWVAHRGTVAGEEGASPAVIGVFERRCPADDRIRAGFWIHATDVSSSDSDEVDLTATPADQEALKAFVGHFDLCR